MIDGDILFACLNKSLTREAPTPTYIWTKSEPLIERKGTPASPATAFARRVLPVPGGPTSKAPLGIFAPSFLYFSGFFKKSTNSTTSYLAFVIPATCLNRVLIILSTPKI